VYNILLGRGEVSSRVCGHMMDFINARVVSVLVLLTLVSTSRLGVPAEAEQVLGTLSVEDPTTHLHAIDVTVGSVFKVEVWARGVPKPGIVDLHFRIVWDPDLIVFVSHDIHDHGFGVLSGVVRSDSYELEVASPFPHSPFFEDVSWTTLTFRCLGEGSSEIEVAYSHAYYGDYDDDHEFSFSPENATVNQKPPQSATSAGDVEQTIGMLWLALATIGIVCAAILAVATRNHGRNHSH